MDSNATNHAVNATVDDGSCEYPPPPEPPADDDPPTPIDDDDDEDSRGIESETPQKSGIVENISMVNIVLGVFLILLLSVFVLLQLGGRASTNRYDRIR